MQRVGILRTLIYITFKSDGGNQTRCILSSGREWNRVVLGQRRRRPGLSGWEAVQHFFVVNWLVLFGEGFGRSFVALQIFAAQPVGDEAQYADERSD